MGISRKDGYKRTKCSQNSPGLTGTFLLQVHVSAPGDKVVGVDGSSKASSLSYPDADVCPVGQHNQQRKQRTKHGPFQNDGASR